MKTLIRVFATGMLLFFIIGILSSCAAPYACPTYANSKPIYRTNKYNPIKPITYREYVDLAYKKPY